ncbi:MAG: tail fiber domain-containing protein [Firmicutes bacterium]|nr:tail fiber domain-containing protein [Bacillota bacterium]
MAQLDAKQLEARKVKRMRYFDGLFLRQEEFNLEQNYHIRMRRLHNYYLHSYGIVRGLEVKADNVGEEGATVATLRISPGMALIEMTSDIDYNNPENVSQEILITDETIVNISYSNDFKEKEYRFIYLTHTLEKVDIYDDRGGREQIHWWEKAEINCKTEYPKSRSMVVLAKVELTNDTGRKKITNVSVSYEDAGEPLRTYAGSYGKITLPVENAKKDDSLPTIQGKNFGSAGNPVNGIQITAAVTDVEGDLRVNGNTDFTGDWTIVGKTDITGDCAITGKTDITGDLTIKGNITVLEGGMAQIHTVNAEVQDAIFRINRYTPTAQVPQIKNSAGIEIFRGNENGAEIAEKAQLVWNENDDKWYLGVNRQNGLVNITQLTDQSVVDIHRHNQLYTRNGSLALSVNSSGNIGIGAPPPAAQGAKLEVGGKISATELDITGDATFKGILSASTLAVASAIIPSLGKSETNGIMFPKNPGGGKDDGAWIRYYPRAQEGCTLEIGISDDPGDHILLRSPGGVGIGINNLNGFKLNICGDGAGGHVLRIGGDINLHGHDRLNLISFGVDGDYQILHKAGGVFRRNTLALHMDEKDAFGVYSSGLTPLLEVCGGTGDLYIHGNAGIGGGADPAYRLNVAGAVHAEAFYGDGSNLTNIKGGQWIDTTGGIYYGGKVGIYEKNPAVTFTVYQNIDGIKTDVPGIMLGNSKGSASIWQGSDARNYMKIGWNGIDITEKPYASIDVVDPYPLVLQSDGGNVGIGTLNPGATLDVKGTINYTQLAKLETAAIDEAVIRAGILNFGNSRYHRKPGRALVDGNDTLVINSEGFWPNVRIDGMLSFGSSRSTGENVRDLPVKKALEILDSLNPVEFYFKNDTQKSLNIGFLAEDVHETIATSDRTGIVVMNVVGILAKIVKEQQKVIADLQKKVNL